METRLYVVPGMHCGHCVAAVKEEVSAVRRRRAVDVDLETKLVVVTGPPRRRGDPRGDRRRRATRRPDGRGRAPEKQRISLDVEG